MASDAVRNNQLAFDVAEKELGISPIMSGTDMAAPGQPDKLSMVLYLTQFYDVFTEEAPPTGGLTALHSSLVQKHHWLLASFLIVGLFPCHLAFKFVIYLHSPLNLPLVVFIS